MKNPWKIVPSGILIGACLSAGIPVFAQESFIEQTELFIGGAHGVHTYRIPALEVSEKGTVYVYDPPGISIMNSSPGIYTSTGSLIQPSVVRLPNRAEDNQFRTFAINAISDDHGETWKMGGIVGNQIGESKVVEQSDGTITRYGSRSSNEEAYYYTVPVFNPLRDGMGYHNYRIPSFLVTKNNVLLAVAEGREDLNLDHAKNDLVLMRSSNGGETWEKPVIIAEAGDNVTMNPVMVQAEDGTITLSHIYFPQKRHTRQMKAHGVKLVEPGLKGDYIQRFFIITSKDDGATWSESRELTFVAKTGSNTIASICGPGTGITLTRGDYQGRVIIPMQEQLRNGDNMETYLYSLYSDDHGRNWEHGEFAPPDDDGSVGEVQMVELEDGVMLSTRNSSGFRRVAFSNDGGTTWTKLKIEKSLEDTGCMSPLLRYRWKDEEKPGVIIHVGVTARVDGRRRGRAEFCLSYDDGNTWPVCKVFHDETFDYSSLAILPDGSIGMLGEYDFDGERAKIRLAKLNLKWIEGTNGN